MRNGEQAASRLTLLGCSTPCTSRPPVIAGFELGSADGGGHGHGTGRSATGLVSVSGYLIGSQDAGRRPLPPEAELQWWYQYYFATERGRVGYDEYRHDFAKLIWRTASPKWNFDDATFARSAASLDNPDHVAIAIHNYRWRLGLADGEAEHEELERPRRGPVVPVPAITLEGDATVRIIQRPAPTPTSSRVPYSHRPSRRGRAQPSSEAPGFCRRCSRTQRHDRRRPRPHDLTKLHSHPLGDLT